MGLLATERWGNPPGCNISHITRWLACREVGFPIYTLPLHKAQQLRQLSMAPRVAMALQMLNLGFAVMPYESCFSTNFMTGTGFKCLLCQ